MKLPRPGRRRHALASMAGAWLWVALLAPQPACRQPAEPGAATPDRAAETAAPPATAPAAPAPAPAPSAPAATGAGPGPGAPHPGAPPAAAPGTRDEAVVDGVRLTMHGCELAIERPGAAREVVTLPMPGDCLFARGADDSAQVEVTRRGKALLVVSSHPLPGRPGDCDTRVRALVVSAGGVLLSTDEQTIRMCGAQGPFDTPMFHVLATTAEPPR